MENIEAVVAAYAAIVATGALFLEARRWFESGARLKLSLMPEATVIGSGKIEKKGLLVANVVNRGDTPTTITHFGILRFSSPLHRWLGKSKESYLVPNPQLEGNPPVVPKEVGVGQQWMGIAHSRPDVVPNLRDGTYWVAIYATHRDRPTIARIPKRKDILSNSIKLSSSDDKQVDH